MRRPERGISEEVQTPTSFLLCYRYGEPIDLILIINAKTCIYYFKFVSYAICFIVSGQTPFSLVYCLDGSAQDISTGKIYYLSFASKK